MGGKKKAKAQKRGSKKAIVVLGGSFAPPHAGHLAALEAGKRDAEDAGWTVVAGYAAVAHEGHVRSKLRGRGQPAAEELVGAAGRLRLCSALAAGSDWLRPTPCTYGSARQCGAAMLADHAPGTQVIAIKGRDLPSLKTASDGRTLSSTLVREEVEAGGVAAVRRLAKSGALPPEVASELEALLAGVPEQAPEPQPEPQPQPEPELTAALVRTLSDSERAKAEQAWSEAQREEASFEAMSAELQQTQQSIAALQRGHGQGKHGHKAAQKQRPAALHVVVLVGAPGSGKSTLCLELERTTCGPLVRISQDDLGSRKACERLAQRSLKQRRSVIIDRCNFDAQQRSTWLTIARQQ